VTKARRHSLFTPLHEWSNLVKQQLHCVKEDTKFMDLPTADLLTVSSQKISGKYLQREETSLKA